MAARKGHEKVGGRKKGTPNKPTKVLRDALQKHGSVLVKRLLKLTQDKDKNIRLGALKICFDRGWGRPFQEIGGTFDHNYVARMPVPVADAEEWQKQYAPPTMH